MDALNRKPVSRGHVAIVDDDKSVRRAMTRIVASDSLPVKSYASALDFLSSLEIEVPGCLILDLQMPGMTGLQLLQHLAGAGPEIPTIIVTASDEPAIRHRCELAGAMMCFSKPVSADVLLNAVQAVMKRERITTP